MKYPGRICLIRSACAAGLFLIPSLVFGQGVRKSPSIQQGTLDEAASSFRVALCAGDES